MDHDSCKGFATTTHDANIMIASIKGRFGDNKPCAQETAIFCDLLRDYTWRNYRESLIAPDMTPLPRGYRNFRVRDGRDGAILGSTWWVDSTGSTTRTSISRSGVLNTVVTSRPAARCVVAKVLAGFVFEEIDEWRATSVASAEPGMLELVVDIDTRARELIVTGDQLPDHIVAFLAGRAPARARRGTTAR